MSSSVQHQPSVFPGSTPVQRVAGSLVFTSANAGICALTGHLFSLVTLGTGAFFGASAGLIGLGLASQFSLKDVPAYTNLTDMACRTAKAVLSFFVGGGISYLAANAMGLTISMPAASLLMGPLLVTSLGFLALAIASASATKLANQASQAVQEIRGRIGPFLNRV